MSALKLSAIAVTAAASFVLTMGAATPVRAETAQDCIVDDPTPTPLNVRTSPQGRIVGQVPNGRQVVVLDTTRDQYGKPWVYIAERGGRPIGWVFERHVSCF